jgi:hypothetical protein
MRGAVSCVTLLAAASAFAGSVYLNGVRIDGVTNQKFDKVNVRIDEQGNLFIEAPGYNVRQVEGSSEPTKEPPGVLTRKYFLVTEQNVVGMTEYDIDVYVNSKWLRKLRSTDEQIVTDITAKLQPGKNTVLLIAKKATGGTRKSFSKEHVFRVIIGEGQMSGDHVMIDHPVVKFERTAADANDQTQEFTLVTR